MRVDSGHEKTKRIAVGEGLSDEDVAPVRVKVSGEIEMVAHFAYPGSFMSRDGCGVQNC